jgi:hypothetical protein
MDNVSHVNDNYAENKRRGNILPTAKVKLDSDNSNKHGITAATLKLSVKRAYFAYTATRSLYTHLLSSHLH